jgi:hypothetical protein
LTSNGALSCGVLLRCHIVARFKSKDWLKNDRGKLRQRAARQRAVWRALFETGRQDDSATTRHLSHFARDKTKRRYRYRLCCRYRQRNAQSVLIIWWLIWNTFVHRVVASKSTTKFQTARCRTFVLSLTMHTKWRFVVQRVVTMSSNRRIVDTAKRQGDIVTTACFDRDMATRQQCAFASDKTTRRKGDNDIGCVVANDKATRKCTKSATIQISHHRK